MTGPTAGRLERDAAQSGLLPPGEAVVVLLSGGRDSTCLLALAVRLAGAAAVTALHVDHGLQPASGAVAGHCERLGARLGVPVLVERLDAPPEVGNLHAWARERRYAAAGAAARARGARVAAGHTISDQAETVLYRLAASPGRRALLGMAERAPLPGDPGVELVRPLLRTATREDTAAVCAELGLAHLEDPANDDPRFARARARADLLPALRSLHPAAERSVARTAAELREEAEALAAVVDGLLGDEERQPLERLRALHPALRRLAVRELAERAAGRPAPDAGTRAEEILALRPPAQLHLEGGLRAIAHGGALRFEVRPATGPPSGGPGARARV
jgi:tRNA(Ile)-lysidine synthase